MISFAGGIMVTYATLMVTFDHAGGNIRPFRLSEYGVKFSELFSCPWAKKLPCPQ